MVVPSACPVFICQGAVVMYFLEHIKDKMFKPFIVMTPSGKRKKIERLTLTIPIHEVGRDQ